MFLTELTPLGQEFLQQPLAFLGGFMSGILRLNLQEEPIKNWLDQQQACSAQTSPAQTVSSNGTSPGPQSIQID
ncbi:MAG: hypothetical protein VKJ24_04050 [Synechococcales bacterium]|nr:hypothetical protein [Synechococcales bacterium]